jgi:alanine-synthesizing transaminase
MIFSRRSNNPAGGSSPVVARMEDLRASDEASLLDLTCTDTTGWWQRRGLEGECLSYLAGAQGCRYVPDPQGSFDARKRLSAFYGRNVPPEDWFLFASTSEAYSLLFQLLCDPGDQVVVNRPSYPLLDDLARHGGISLVDCPLRWGDSRWQLDIGQLEHHFRKPSVKAYCLIQPGNPTGWFLTSSERFKVLALCAKHQVALISDEVFADFTHEAGFHSLLGESTCLTFVLSGLSKSFGLPGLKLGWAGVSGTAEEVSQARERLQRLNDSLLSASTPVQMALDRIFPLKEALLEPLRERLRHNLDVWSHVFPAMGRVLPVPAGWMGILQLDPGTEERLCKRLLDRKLLVQPGFLFDLPWDGVVISLMTEPKRFGQGIQVLLEELQGISSLSLKKLN